MDDKLRKAAVDLALQIAHETVWCALTTVDSSGRPRNRVVHPVWTDEDGRLTGWLTTRRTPIKVAHLAGNPNVSLAYIGKGTDLAYFDCTAEWLESPKDKEACWRAFLSAPEPARYDPALIWPGGPDSETFAALRFTPYRVQAARAEQIGRGEKPLLARFSGGRVA